MNNEEFLISLTRIEPIALVVDLFIMIKSYS